MNCVVLVVDFEPRSAAATKALLEPRGCEVHVAGTTRDLETYLAREFPAVVVLEPMLPGLDGFRFIRALKARKGGRVPVVVTASRIFKGQRYRTMGREAGADLVLERPQDDPQLVAAVDKAVTQLRGESGTANDTAALSARSGPASGPVPPAGTERAPLVQQFKAPLSVPSVVTSELDPAALRNAPGGAPEQELDQLVDRMFESCFEKAPDGTVEPAAAASVAVAPAEAPRAPAPRPKIDSSTREMLSTLDEIEHSLPQSEGARGNRADALREVETSVPLAPPPRSEDERSLDEVLEKITGQVPPAPAARRPAAPKPAPKPEPPPPATSSSFSSVLTETPPAAAAPLYRKLLIPAVVVLAVVAGGAYVMLKPSATPVQNTAAPTAAPAPVETSPAPATTATTAPATPPPAAVAPAVTPNPQAASAPRKVADAKPVASSPVAAKPAEIAPAPAAAAPVAAAPVSTEPAPAPATQPEPAAVKVEEAPAVVPPPPAPEPAPAAVPAVAAAPQASEPDGPPVPGVGGVSRPQPIVKTEPVYPAVAKARGIKGTVILRLKIHVDGSVGDVTVLREPEGSGLGRAAANAVKNWRYKPAMLRGRPVEVDYTQTLTFN